MHGKTSRIRHRGQGVFAGLPDGYEATRYHSLVVAQESLPDCLEVTAWTDNADGSCRRNHGPAPQEHPVEGVQFHPESILTEHGHALLHNFLAYRALRHERHGEWHDHPATSPAAHDRASRDLPRRDGRADAHDHARRSLAHDDRGDPHRPAGEEGNRRRDRRRGDGDARVRATGGRRRSHAHLVDIVGTGGDGAHTLQHLDRIDVRRAPRPARKVAKHGNRSVSSKSGSADVLEALGAAIELQPEQVAHCIAETGIGFMFAPCTIRR